MIEHLKDYCDRFLNRTDSGRDLFNSPKEIYPQLVTLDPRDFEQARRADFMVIRGSFEHLVNPNKHETVNGSVVLDALKQLREVLEFYLAEGTYLDAKPFTFLRDPDLIDIIKRDYRELSLRLYPSHSWKSYVVLAGSILEAILYDVLSGPRNQANADTYVMSLLSPNIGHRAQSRQAAGRYRLSSTARSTFACSVLRIKGSSIKHFGISETSSTQQRKCGRRTP